MSDKQCIFILADGARADLFEYLLGKGDLPNIARYIVEKGDFAKGTSVFPSTTGPAYLPYILGKFPGNCNLPGIRWFDRQLYGTNKVTLGRFRSYIGLETYLINRDIAYDGVPTVFEYFPESVSILNEITRGVGFHGDKTRFRKMYYKIKSHFTGSCDEVDDAAARFMLSALDSSPEFIFTVFLGIDTYSHQKHPFHKSVIESYMRIDGYVEQLAEKLKRQGRMDETLIILGSDHGLTSTHTHFDSLGFMNKLGYKTFYYPNVFRHLLDADAANMVSGNSMAHMYFKNNNGWHERTSVEELSEIVEILTERKEVDLVLGMSETGEIAIFSEKGEARTRMDNGTIHYTANNGDPLGLNMNSTVTDSNEHLARTFDSEYPDVLVQVNQLFKSQRTGDIVISAKTGFDLRARHEKPEHCSSHGSLGAEHMKVPLAINRKINRKHVRTVDIYPTILEFFGKPLPANIDGVSLIEKGE